MLSSPATRRVRRLVFPLEPIESIRAALKTLRATTVTCSPAGDTRLSSDEEKQVLKQVETLEFLIEGVSEHLEHFWALCTYTNHHDDTMTVEEALSTLQATFSLPIAVLEGLAADTVNSITSPAFDSPRDRPKLAQSLAASLELVKEHIWPRISAFRKFSNSRRPVNGLPVELLVTVLELAIELDDQATTRVERLLQLGFVCRSWRDVIYGACPFLWAKVEHVRGIDHALKHSGQRPITVSGLQVQSEDTEALEHLVEHMERWKSVEMYLHPTLCATLSRLAAGRPAPILEKFFISVIPDYAHAATEWLMHSRRLRLFEAGAPHLRVLFVAGLQLPYYHPRVLNVEELHLEGVYLKAGDLLNAIASNDNLRSLWLDGVSVPANEWAPATPVCHHGLKRVVLLPNACEHILPHLDLPHCEYLDARIGTQHRTELSPTAQAALSHISRHIITTSPNRLILTWNIRGVGPSLRRPPSTFGFDGARTATAYHLDVCLPSDWNGGPTWMASVRSFLEPALQQVRRLAVGVLFDWAPSDKDRDQITRRPPKLDSLCRVREMGRDTLEYLACMRGLDTIAVSGDIPEALKIALGNPARLMHGSQHAFPELALFMVYDGVERPALRDLCEALYRRHERTSAPPLKKFVLPLDLARGEEWHLARVLLATGACLSLV